MNDEDDDDIMCDEDDIICDVDDEDDDMSDEDDIMSDYMSGSDEYDVSEEENEIESIRNNDPTRDEYDADIYRNLEQLSKALVGNTHLTRLQVYYCGGSINNRDYNEHDVQNLTSAVANAKITHLSLIWLGHYDDDKDRLITDCLLDALKQSPTIQHLRVVMINIIGMHEIVSCMPHLQSMHLRAANNIKLLREGLQSTSCTLTSLHLSETYIGTTDDFRLLSLALASNLSLTTLCLESCGMDDDGVRAFLDHWHHDSQISTLAFVNTETFTNNGITAEGAMLLLQAASSHPAMESLSIKINEGIGYDGIANIAVELLPNVVLKSLNLAWCVTPPRFRSVGSNLGEADALVGGLIAQGVKANTHLIEIDVSENGFDVAGHVVDGTLAFYMLRNKYSPLMVSELHVPVSVWCHCFATNGQNASFMYHFLREQPMLWNVCGKNKKTTHQPDLR